MIFPRAGARARPAGEAAGGGDKSPLFLRHGDGEVRGVLCLHGFTGTPFEVRPLAEALAGRGFTVSVPALAGHCGTVEDLARTRWPDWLASAEGALDELVRTVGGARVAVVGFSLGGLLALRLARLRAEQIAALVVMAAPLRLRPYQARVVRILARLPALLRRGPFRAVPKLRGYDLVDEEMRMQNPALTAMPVVGLASLLELAGVVRRDLADIRTPTLVVHGERDRTVPLQDSLELVGSLGAPVVERLFLPRSGHLVAIDLDRSALVEAVSRFVAAHLPAVRPAAASGSSS
jgi:carboxylesterase